MNISYKGFIIKPTHGHFVVVGPDGTSWTEDTIEDAKKAIEEQLEETE